MVSVHHLLLLARASVTNDPSVLFPAGPISLENGTLSQADTSSQWCMTSAVVTSGGSAGTEESDL